MAEEFVSFAEFLWKLPLFDDLFLSMQGQNVILVDLYLRDLERDLLRELIEIERTPFPATLIVSALSQMWIFAVYELLRTWRQRVKDLKRDALKPAVRDAALPINSKLLLSIRALLELRKREKPSLSASPFFKSLSISQGWFISNFTPSLALFFYDAVDSVALSEPLLLGEIEMFHIATLRPQFLREWVDVKKTTET
jgi:hypothetical protein